MLEEAGAGRRAGGGRSRGAELRGRERGGAIAGHRRAGVATVGEFRIRRQFVACHGWAAGRASRTNFAEGELNMSAPYGLEIIDSCSNCSWKSEDFFCQLSPKPMRDFEEVKYTSSYPANAMLFVEGQVPRGAYLLCKGGIKLTMTF